MRVVAGALIFSRGGAGRKWSSACDSERKHGENIYMLVQLGGGGGGGGVWWRPDGLSNKSESITPARL